MTPDDILDALESSGALQTGHFKLSSGKHSDRYVQKQLVFTDPRLTMRLAEALLERVPRDFDVVVSPALGAIAWGFAVAHAAGVRFVFTERGDDGTMQIRRAQHLAPAERVLVVEDVMTTGGSAQEVLDVVRAVGAEPTTVAVLVDRTVAPPAFPLAALLRLEVNAWDPERCPLCAAGEPMSSPGSRYLARPGG